MASAATPPQVIAYLYFIIIMIWAYDLFAVVDLSSKSARFFQQFK
jgi:hypothetical protein